MKVPAVAKSRRDRATVLMLGTGARAPTTGSVDRRQARRSQLHTKASRYLPRIDLGQAVRTPALNGGRHPGHQMRR